MISVIFGAFTHLQFLSHNFLIACYHTNFNNNNDKKNRQRKKNSNFFFVFQEKKKKLHTTKTYVMTTKCCSYWTNFVQLLNYRWKIAGAHNRNRVLSDKIVANIENTSHIYISIAVNINYKMNYQQSLMCAAIECSLVESDCQQILVLQQNADPVS